MLQTDSSMHRESTMKFFINTTCQLDLYPEGQNHSDDFRSVGGPILWAEFNTSLRPFGPAMALGVGTVGVWCITKEDYLKDSTVETLTFKISSLIDPHPDFESTPPYLFPAQEESVKPL